MKQLVLWYSGYLAALSLISFIVCAFDKFAAKKDWRRVPEKRLFFLSAFGGAIGMLAGMLIMRHKTRHLSFRIIVPILAILQYTIGLLLYVYL